MASVILDRVPGLTRDLIATRPRIKSGAGITSKPEGASQWR